MKVAPVGYFDIECASWDGFVVGAALAPDASRPELVWHDSGALLDLLAASPGTEWRAHYSGRYDTLLLLTLACRAGWRVTLSMRGASVLRARLRRPGDKRTTVTLVDTFALAPVGLAKLSKAAGGVVKGELDFRRLDAEGPTLRPGSAFGRQVAEYLTHDVLALRDGDTAWRQVLREVAGVEPSTTLGATAWKSAALGLGACGEDVSDALFRREYNDGRAGYYGGRVEVFSTAEPLVHRYDRNSSYPAALTRQPVPVGRRLWRPTWNGEEGTVWCRVKVPESRHPPLPARCRDRLVYPHGVFDGAWSAVELRYALSQGVELVKVHKARIATQTTDALSAWCQRVWTERVARPAWGGLLKLLANSLTGKLAQRPERAHTAFTAVNEVPRGADTLTKPRDGMVWWRTVAESVSPCGRPEWAAYLTAEARTELHRQLEAAGASSVYSDTDSVYATAPLDRELGAELGQWKHEGIGRDWHAAAPKLYRYTDEKGTTVKARGQRGLTPEGYERLVHAASLPDDDAGEDARVAARWETREGVDSLATSLRRQGEAGFTRTSLRRGLARADAWCGGRLRTRSPETEAPPYELAVARWGAGV